MLPLRKSPVEDDIESMHSNSSIAQDKSPKQGKPFVPILDLNKVPLPISDNGNNGDQPLEELI